MIKASVLIVLGMVFSSPLYAARVSHVTGLTSRLICRISQFEVHIVQVQSAEGYKVRSGSVWLDEGMGPMTSRLHKFRVIANPLDQRSSGVSVFKFEAFDREFTLRVAQNAYFQLTDKTANSVAFGAEIPEPAICESHPAN